MILMRQLTRLPYKLKRGFHVYASLYLRHQTPFLIYTTGRVGSMALHYSLEERGAFAFQIHTLNASKLVENQQPGTAVWAYRHIIEPGRRAKIINLFRDPLAVMISDFFPKLRWITGQKEAYFHYSVDELCSIFNTRYFADGRHLEKLNWYENEMQASLGINVYEQNSPRDTGCTRFENSHYDILLIKTELDDTLKAQIIGEFAGLENFTLIRRNVGESKDYGEVYKAFKQRLIVPDERLNEIYGSRYAQHFFSADEIEVMRSRWQVSQIE
jgi:hypothetical protein